MFKVVFMSLLLTRKKCHTMPTCQGPARVGFGHWRGESEMKMTVAIFKNVLVKSELYI